MASTWLFRALGPLMGAARVRPAGEVWRMAMRHSRPAWSPPRTERERDALMNKLVKDNEVLMAEVAELDSRLRRALEEKAALQKQVEIGPRTKNSKLSYRARCRNTQTSEAAGAVTRGRLHRAVVVLGAAEHVYDMA